MKTGQTDLSATSKQKPLWMHPIWLVVIGGPLVVVIAAIITAVIAVRGQDPVLDRAADPEHSAPSVRNGALERDRALLPAVEGRNHAVTPSQAEASSRAQ